MNKVMAQAVLQFCKKLGCCDACCIRLLGIKDPNAYEKSSDYVNKYNIRNGNSEINNSTDIPKEVIQTNNMEPPSKRQKDAICVCCLGLLQEESWPDCFNLVRETLNKKQYVCDKFACALSAPISTLLREKVLSVLIKHNHPNYDPKVLTPLKEAWKWSFGSHLSQQIEKSLDSGAVCPLLITLNMEYPDDLQELEILKTLSPQLFEERNRQKRRFTVEFTRRSVEQALDSVTVESLQAVDNWKNKIPSVTVRCRCVSVMTTHAPVYVGGRYIKLSRELPQTPWLVKGIRMMESSVQEIIFGPIAKLYGISNEDIDHRLKFISAGREDVDVRCLGDGRPFAIEVTDPCRQLTSEELTTACKEISSGGKIIVKMLMPVTRDDLTELKKGEETKCKTYEGICIKLDHTKEDIAEGATEITITQRDIDNINAYRNTDETDAARILIAQKTPIRVLHRRPLLTRPRRIYDLEAFPIPGKGSSPLFAIRIVTQAGTYVKEWAHGELGRTRPSLQHALGATVDMLALDVAKVHLDWPKTTKTTSQ